MAGSSRAGRMTEVPRAHALGRSGEDLAAAYLERQGWHILDRNWRFHRKEIDLVMRRGDVVAFLEVKTRGAGSLGHPLDAIGPAKRRDLAVAARGWIALRGRPRDTYRFDAVAITREGATTRLEHVPDAWRI